MTLFIEPPESAGTLLGIAFENARKRRSARSEEHTSELQSRENLVCRLLPPPSSTLFPYTTLFRSCLPGCRLCRPRRFLRRGLRLWFRRKPSLVPCRFRPS